MTTFERVRRNILRDMAGSKTHTAASWANIMLTNTARLTNVSEQKLFWAWVENPTDEERPAPVCDVFDEHALVEIAKLVTVTDNGQTVQLEQEVFKNGATTFIRVKPVAVLEEPDEKEEKE